MLRETDTLIATTTRHGAVFLALFHTPTYTS